MPVVDTALYRILKVDVILLIFELLLLQVRTLRKFSLPYKWAWLSNDACAIAVPIFQKKFQQSLQNSFSVSDTLEIISF